MFRGSALPKTIAILSAIAVALIAMFIVPIDFDLEGNGKFKPLDEKQVYAHVDGEVAGVFVKNGDIVQANTPLLQLKNSELEQQISSIKGDIATSIAKRNSAFELQNAPRLTELERNRVQQDIAESTTTIDSKTEQLALLEAKQQKLLRLSPIAGMVTTWDVEKVLNARPVVTGQLLMTVTNLDGDWEIEVRMPEKRMRYLDLAMKEAKDKGLDYLEMDFVLKSATEVTRKGKLLTIGVSQRAELDTEDGSVVKLRCIPDAEAMQLIRKYPGAEVIAGVKCGKRSAAFVWFHEVVEWLRINVWF